jgi:hypothetical protein
VKKTPPTYVRGNRFRPPAALKAKIEALQAELTKLEATATRLRAGTRPADKLMAEIPRMRADAMSAGLAV